MTRHSYKQLLFHLPLDCIFSDVSLQASGDLLDGFCLRLDGVRGHPKPGEPGARCPEEGQERRKVRQIYLHTLRLKAAMKNKVCISIKICFRNGEAIRNAPSIKHGFTYVFNRSSTFPFGSPTSTSLSTETLSRSARKTRTADLWAAAVSAFRGFPDRRLIMEFLQ